MNEYKLEKLELINNPSEGVASYIIVYSGTKFNGYVVENVRVEFCSALKNIEQIPKCFFYKCDIYNYFGLKEFGTSLDDSPETII